MTTRSYCKMNMMGGDHMETVGRRLRLVYRSFSDGPHVLLFGPLDADFHSLQDLFQRLGQSAGQYELHRQPFVAAFNETQVTMVSCGHFYSRPDDPQGGIHRVAGSKGNHFEWRRTTEGWAYFAELVDSLVRSERPGHHELTRYPREDAIVEVAKGEYDDTVLMAERVGLIQRLRRWRQCEPG